MSAEKALISVIMATEKRAVKWTSMFFLSLGLPQDEISWRCGQGRYSIAPDWLSELYVICSRLLLTFE